MSKTNTGLVEYAESKIGTLYFYGAKMEEVTERLYHTLTGLYPNMYPSPDKDKGKIGKVCCDCSGLISAYTGRQRSSAQFRQDVIDKVGRTCVHAINTIDLAPVGALVWKEGHIGVYAGVENGKKMYIAEDGSAWGCRKRALSEARFTHWFQCTDIEYVAESGNDCKGDGGNAAKSESSFASYTVKITADTLNCRSGAGANFPPMGTVKKGEQYTIVAEADGKSNNADGTAKWGRLKGRGGWVNLAFTERA